MSKISKVECFKISLLECEDIFKISFGNMIKKINNDDNLMAEPTTIIADPFLFVKNDKLFLFFEKKELYSNGVIAMTYTSDLKEWSEPRIVLKEKCHLSYPWVFEYDNQTYMIPETCGLNSINIYAANKDLTSFKFVKTILRDENINRTGFSFSDSSIYRKNGKCYLMTTVNDGEENILKLYVSDSLLGNYKEHRKSPIYIGNKYGRNAGNIFEYKGKLYRVAQDCVERYGDNVHVLEILKMDVDDYCEKVAYEYIIPTDVEFYKEGGHQFNYIRFKNKNIIATDAKGYKYFLGQRLLHKLGCY